MELDESAKRHSKDFVEVQELIVYESDTDSMLERQSNLLGSIVSNDHNHLVGSIPSDDTNIHNDQRSDSMLAQKAANDQDV